MSSSDSYFGFLAGTGRLFSGSFGPEEAVEEAVRMAVPRLADWCAVQLMDEYRAIQSATVARMGPDGPDGPGDVILTHRNFPRGHSSASPAVTPLEEFPAEATLVFPLAESGHVLGILTVGMAGPGGFSEAQAQLIKEFARCVSFGLYRIRNLEETKEKRPGAEARWPTSFVHGDDLPKAILEHLADFASVFEVLPGGDYRLRFANAALLRSLGLEGTHWEGARLEEIVPEPRFEFRRLAAQVLELGQPLEFSHPSLLDPARWIQTKLIPIRNPEGRITHILSSSRDISAFKRANEEVRKTRDLLQTALDTLRDPVLVLDPGGRPLFMNLALAKALGCTSVEEAMAMSRGDWAARLEVLDAEGRNIALTEGPVADALAGRTPAASHLRCRNLRTGRDVWYEVAATPQFDAPGKVGLVIVTGHDLTGMRAAQADLASKEERFRLALDVGHIGVWDYDVASDRHVWSGFMAEIHGLGLGQEPGNQKDFLERVHPEDRVRVAELHRKSIRERIFFEAEYRIQRPTGEERWLHAAGGVLLDSDGRATRFIGASSDVTERKMAEEAAFHVQRKVQEMTKVEAIGRLAGGVSHDFNNLLMAINGYADLILASEQDIGGIRQYVSEIRTSGERAAGITRQLLAYGRRQMLQPKVTDLNEVVRSMLDLLEKLTSGSVGLTSELQPDLERVMVDTGQMKQVILNLVMNARDSMPKGGMIVLGTRTADLDVPVDEVEVEIPPGRYVVLEISDSGEGMEPEVLKRIFDPFFTTKPLGMKTGLGLSMVQGIVRQSGGYIQVASRKGSGTQFKIYLPVMVAA